jgi:Alcohol dehydrogenase GroES-like domain
VVDSIWHRERVTLAAAHMASTGVASDRQRDSYFDRTHATVASRTVSRCNCSLSIVQTDRFSAVSDMCLRTVRSPGVGEVRINVKAAAVNPTDIGLRERGIPDQIWTVVPGMDAAGIIESVGPGVSRLQTGQKVMAAVMPRRSEGGAQAEHIVVLAASVVPIPEGVSLAEASTLPMNGLTALRALELAALGTGQFFAVSGGAGLLAHYAIAAAKHQGQKVIADAKLEEAELVRSYGADIVVERGPGFADAIRREAGETSRARGESRSSEYLCLKSWNVPNGSNCSATWWPPRRSSCAWQGNTRPSALPMRSVRSRPAAFAADRLAAWSKLNCADSTSLPCAACQEEFK